MNVLHTATLKSPRLRLEIRAVDPARDLDLIWSWWMAPHVLGNWSLLFRLGPPREGAEPYCKADLQRYLERVLAPESELKPLILRIEGEDIGYAEEYQVGSSPLAKHPVVQAEDRGVHLILGDVRFPGRGLATQILAILAKWQLEKFPRASKVMGDPDVRNLRAVKAVANIPGAVRLDDYPLAYKTAALFILGARERMAELC